MKKQHYNWIAAAAVLLMTALLSFPSMAANYAVKTPSWESNNDGYAVATWEHSDEKADKTTWKIRLYRSAEGKPVSKWIVTSKDWVDFSTIISRTGTGRYYFEVYPTKGGDKMKITSDYLIMDGSELDNCKKFVKEREENQEDTLTAYGWVKNPNGTWKYHYTDGSYATGWRDIDGKTYYFSTTRVMLSGWQIINNRWYYFDETSGALLRNGTSPEGYSTNADGMLVIDGQPVDASFQPKNTAKNSAKVLTDLTEIKIVSKETKVDANVVRPMEVTSGGKFSVETYSFSKPYEEWKPGEPVTVVCTLCANTGYCFTDQTQVKFNRGSLSSFTGGAVERVLVYTYYPRLVLPSPENVVLNYDEQLRWSPCVNAARYIIRITIDGERVNDIYVNTNHFDFSSYNYQDNTTVSISAIANESVRNYYYDSFETKITNLDTIRVEGKFVQSSTSLIYRDVEGNLVDGWVEMLGHWFHFTNGYASGPGWWQDKNGVWYYFDNNYRMVTGEISVDGKTYFLNDGSNTSLPLGAWIQ